MFFFTFWKGKCIKTVSYELWLMCVKNRLVKVVFTNVHKISDACANSYGRYIMIAQGFSGKMVFLKRLKLIYPQHCDNCSTPTFLILFKKIVSLTPI